MGEGLRLSCSFPTRNALHLPPHEQHLIGLKITRTERSIKGIELEFNISSYCTFYIMLARAGVDLVAFTSMSCHMHVHAYFSRCPRCRFSCRFALAHAHACLCWGMSVSIPTCTCAYRYLMRLSHSHIKHPLCPVRVCVCVCVCCPVYFCTRVSARTWRAGFQTTSLLLRN